MLAFPRGEHDDSLDSLAFAIQTSELENSIDWDRVVSTVYARKSRPYVTKI